MFYYDIVWYETFWYQDQVQEHPLTLHAFGINHKTFYPKSFVKDIDIISVGKLIRNKHHEKILSLPRDTKVVVGQKDNSEYSKQLVRTLTDRGVIFINYLDPDQLCVLLNRSKLVLIASDLLGGGERVLLEARSCGTHFHINTNNPKLVELSTSTIYDSLHYGGQIKRGLIKLEHRLMGKNSL